MPTEHHLYALALRLTPNIGDQNFRKLLGFASSAKEIWMASKKDLTQIEGIGEKTVAYIGQLDILKAAEAELSFCENEGITIIIRNDKKYPNLLSYCDDAPAVLFVKGKLPQEKGVSMVGTRKITANGKKFIQDFFEHTAGREFCSVSGLALGVDAEVHQSSIKFNVPTVAVLAHGFCYLYPSSHRKLSEKIIEEGGALVTEFTSMRRPDRENFIQRNRVIAGFSAATVVAETAFGGGSVSTAHFANGYGREVYALPGRYTDAVSLGCNHLIYQNKAVAITTVSQLAKDLGLGKEEFQKPNLFPDEEKSSKIPLEYRKIYEVIQEHSGIALDDLFNKIEMGMSALLAALLQLELQGFIKSTSARTYRCL